MEALNRGIVDIKLDIRLVFGGKRAVNLGTVNRSIVALCRKPDHSDRMIK